MTADRSTLTSAQVEEITTATIATRILQGRSKVTSLGRSNLPSYNWFRKHAMTAKAATPVQGGYRYYVKGERDQDLQSYSGNDVVTFSEQQTLFSLEYFIGKVHLGEQVVHQVLQEAGITIVYGKTTSNGELPRVAPDLWERVVNILENRLDDLEWNFVERIAEAMWTDNSADPKLWLGIDNLLPISGNDTGTIGGKSRTNPLLRHYLATSLSILDFPHTIQKARRTCNDGTLDGSKVDAIFAGYTVIDKLKEYFLGASSGITGAERRIDYQWAVDKAQELGGKLGIGLPDDAFYVPGVALIVPEPLFERLHAKYPSASVAWNKRTYGFNSKHLDFLAPMGVEGAKEIHPRPYNQFVTRISQFGDYCLGTDKPDSHFVLGLS